MVSLGFRDIKNIFTRKKTPGGALLPRPRRAAVFFGIGLALGILLMLLLAADGYLFYLARLRPALPQAPARDTRDAVSGKDLDRIRAALDRRAEDLGRILSPTP